MKKFALEFGRYFIVGGLAFIADFGVMTACKEWLFSTIPYGLYYAVTLGFIVGLIVNYFLSIRFVFESAKTKGTGKSVQGFLGFLVIAIVGLLLTQLIMFLGVETFRFHYTLVKIFATGVVFVYNFLAKKFIIFSK